LRRTNPAISVTHCLHITGQQKCHCVVRELGDVWHLKTSENPAEKSARPEKAAHYTVRFAVLQEKRMSTSH
jgi:hypothetical protein